MILSVSRRTDIPAYYADWFFERIRAGEVLVRNPMNPRQVARIPVTREVVDGIVFWTKDPSPLLHRLSLLTPYPYYVQVTITAYGTDVEAGVPDAFARMIPAVQRLANAIGPERVIWRYDPILLSHAYSMQRHLDTFERMASMLQGYTRRCITGFIDSSYKSTQKNAAHLVLDAITTETMHQVIAALSRVSAANGMTLYTCCEAEDYSNYGVQPAACIDAALLESIGGVPLRARKDPNQRKGCRCAESIDIGAYNTCRHGCRYCYANYNDALIPRNAAEHDPKSPLLVGHPAAGDRVYERKISSAREIQTRFL